MGMYLSTLLEKFLESLSGKRNVRILMVGLDGAGKTTILYKLKVGEIVHTIPTIGFNVETLEYKNLTMTVWDVGGQTTIRPLWRHYYPGTHAVIYVVDSSDSARIQEATEELDEVLGADELRDAALLVLANKQDLPMSSTVSEVTERMRLHKVHGRRWYVQGTCAVNGSGIFEGLDWLNRELQKDQK